MFFGRIVLWNHFDHGGGVLCVRIDGIFDWWREFGQLMAEHRCSTRSLLWVKVHALQQQRFELWGDAAWRNRHGVTLHDLHCQPGWCRRIVVNERRSTQDGGNDSDADAVNVGPDRRLLAFQNLGSDESHRRHNLSRGRCAPIG